MGLPKNAAGSSSNTDSPRRSDASNPAASTTASDAAGVEYP